MKSFLPAIIFSLAAAIAYPQEAPHCFERPGNDYPQHLIKESDDTYLVVGSGYTWDPEKWRVLLTRFKADGTVLWEKTFEKNEPLDLRIQPFQNGYVLTGKEWFQTIQPKEKPFVKYLSDAGEEIWSVDFPTDNYFFNDIANQILVDESGEAFYIGVYNHLRKFDQWGNELMSVSLDSLGFGAMASLEYFFRDEALNWYFYLEQYGAGYLAKLSPGFSVTWVKYIDSELQFSYPSQILHDDKNQLLFVGHEYDQPGNRYWKGLLFGSDGELRWSKRFEAPFSKNGYLRSAIDFGDGFVLFGNTFRIEPPQYNYRYYPLILKISESGEEEWHYELPYYGFHYSGMQIVEEENYRFSFSGHFECEEINGYDIYFDQIEIPADLIGLIGEQAERETIPSAISISPNPSPGAFHLDLVEVRKQVRASVFSPDGTLQSITFFEETRHATLHADGPPGLYFLMLEWEGGGRKMMKLVKI